MIQVTFKEIIDFNSLINIYIVWKQNGYQPKIKSMNLCGNDDFDDPHMNLYIINAINLYIYMFPQKNR